MPVPCPCGGWVSFHHCLFGCRVLAGHFLRVTQHLRDLSLPLDMTSLVAAGERDVPFLAATAGLIMTSQVGHLL